MLTFLRQRAKKAAAQILIVILILSFVVWGAADFLRGPDAATLAYVGEQAVTLVEFEDAYAQELLNLSLRTGRTVTRQEARDLGLPMQIFNHLLAQKTLDQVVEDYTLSLSDARLAEEIRRNPLFQDSSGGFSRARLDQILKQIKMKEEMFVEKERAFQKRRQLVTSLFGTAPLSSAFAEGLMAYARETRDFRYILLSAAQLPPLQEPDEATLRHYFETHTEQFQEEEKRSFVTLTLNEAALRKPESVTMAEIEKAYARARSFYEIPEKRHIFQLRFQSRVEAEKAQRTLQQGLSEGKAFAALLTGVGGILKEADLGLKTQDALADPAVAEAAFTLPEKELSSVIEGQFGPVVVYVATIVPAKTTPLEEVAEALRQDLAQVAAQKALGGVRNQIEDGLASGSTLSEISKSLGIPLDSFSFLTRSKGAEGISEEVLPPTQAARINEALLTAVFSAEVGTENPPLEDPETGSMTWFEVTQIAPTRLPSFSEVRSAVDVAWHSARTEEALTQQIGEILKELKRGVSLETVAEARGVSVQQEFGITRTRLLEMFPQAVDLGATGERIFRAPPSTPAVLVTAPQTQAVFVIDALHLSPFFPEEVDTQKLQEDLNTAFSELLLSLYIREQQQKMGVSVNKRLHTSVVTQGDSLP